ncbi:MAG: hypothetical protein WB053_11160 [Nitrososphaeraceae archaeon]
MSTTITASIIDAMTPNLLVVNDGREQRRIIFEVSSHVVFPKNVRLMLG